MVSVPRHKSRAIKAPLFRFYKINHDHEPRQEHFVCYWHDIEGLNIAEVFRYPITSEGP